ncbi:unnamed protein product, partial [Owenia fusiformis]
EPFCYKGITTYTDTVSCPLPESLTNGPLNYVPDDAFTASSYYTTTGFYNYPPAHAALRARITNEATPTKYGAWVAGVKDTAQYIQVDLGDTFYVYTIKTLGRDRITTNSDEA